MAARFRSRRRRDTGTLAERRVVRHIGRMAKEQVFSCNVCGATQSKWAGRCEACGSWNTMVEEVPLSTGPGSRPKSRGNALALTDLATAEAPPPRTEAGVAELDRVLGGGLVAASAILVGGDPGIGKSTLLLQAAARFARNGLKVLYVTGEESASQVQMRAQRPA
jgi:DNA repair protein RadA/Sms